ncbi:MAG: STAS domain-containing protein [Oligoflexia bacterium]|nr:STAS domain-containing protein [Oligoflexia bacterium]
MAVFKMGRLIKFIPFPVVTGFTSGIALSILFKQLRDFMGLSMQDVSPEFPELCRQYYESIHTVNTNTIIIGGVSLLIMIFWKNIAGKISKYVPASFFAILAGTFLVGYFHMTDVATIGGRFHDIKAGLPAFTFPSDIDFATVRSLVGPAFGIAMLAAIESLLSAVVADGMIGGHHRSNAELMGQGLANIFSVLLGGLPATGAIARTAMNVRSGGRTPVAGIVHSLTVLVIMIAMMPFMNMIPLTVLAAVLIVVAYNIGDWRVFTNIRKAPKSDSTVFILTFLLTVVFDLVIAIEVGIVLASFLFMRRMAELSSVDLVEYNGTDSLNEEKLREKIQADYSDSVLLYEIKGPFCFGAAEKLMDVDKQIGANIRLIILKMKDVMAIDATGVHYLEMFINICRSRRISLFICNLQKHPHKVLKKAGILELLGPDYICDNVESIAKVI